MQLVAYLFGSLCAVDDLLNGFLVSSLFVLKQVLDDLLVAKLDVERVS